MKSSDFLYLSMQMTTHISFPFFKYQLVIQIKSSTFNCLPPIHCSRFSQSYSPAVSKPTLHSLPSLPILQCICYVVLYYFILLPCTLSHYRTLSALSLAPIRINKVI